MASTPHTERIGHEVFSENMGKLKKNNNDFIISFLIFMILYHFVHDENFGPDLPFKENA